MDKTKPFKRGLETQLILAFMETLSPGDEPTYEDFEKACGEPCGPKMAKYYSLYSAIKIFKNEGKGVFRNIEKYGYRLLLQEEIPNYNSRLIRKTRAVCDEGTKELASIDYDKLPADLKATYNRNMTLFRFTRKVWNPPFLRGIERAVTKKEDLLPTDDMVEMFRRKKST